MNDKNAVGVDLGTFWLPRQSSTIAAEMDLGWDVAYWLSVFFFVGIVAAMAYFMWRYRRRSENDITSTVDHSLPIEITWTVIPSIMCVGLFLVGFKGYINASIAPAESYEVQVRAQKWSWKFIYPNGTVADELRVPLGKPVRLIMSSTDVLHSFYVPEFRIKADVVPGNYTTVWFEATELGEKQIFCTEYCGDDHSFMLASVIVLEPAKFQEWLQSTEGPPAGVSPVEHGQKLFARNCASCHTVDGTARVGPTLLKVFGKDEKLADGSTVKVDENYLRESILNPNAKVVFGFQPVMSPFKGLLKDHELDALIAYIKELK